MYICPVDMGPMLPSANPERSPVVGKDDWWPCDGALVLNSIAQAGGLADKGKSCKVLSVASPGCPLEWRW